MFGGISFLVSGNMAVGIIGDGTFLHGGILGKAQRCQQWPHGAPPLFRFMMPCRCQDAQGGVTPATETAS